MKTTVTKLTFLNSGALHLLAMALMLCDHLWATVIYGSEWLTDVGRLAFPLFAFLFAEGYAHTKDRKNYFLRLLAAALISEVPFDLMYGGTWFYPFHQNVIWTFLISFGVLFLTDLVDRRGYKVLTLLCFLLFAFVGYFAAFLLMTDYYGYGVLTVLCFYIFRGREIWKKVLLAVGMILINCFMMDGMVFSVTLLGFDINLPQQGLAVFALIPVFFYNGERGFHGKSWRIFEYLFYPVHMLILSLVSLFLL